MSDPALLNTTRVSTPRFTPSKSRTKRRLRGNHPAMKRANGPKKQKYIYLAPLLDAAGEFLDSRLSEFSERHRIQLPAVPLNTSNQVGQQTLDCDATGAVIEMFFGWPGRRPLSLAGRLLKKGKQVYFYWPEEQAIECMDRERLRSYWRMWFVVRATMLYMRVQELVRRVRRKISWRRVRGVAAPLPPEPVTAVVHNIFNRCESEVQTLIQNASPVPLSAMKFRADDPKIIQGTGVYLRTDYWVEINSGGSYTHTCYVANELAQRTENFLAITPTRYELLDELKIRQVCMPRPCNHCSEQDLLSANQFLEPRLRLAIEALRPAYIYERLCLGNYVGAALSSKLRIPYIVEYNGSEISMSKSFADGAPQSNEALLMRIEEAAFHQATLISVVSVPIKESLVRRGVPAEKILVNPNGVDVDSYRPASEPEKQALRAELECPGDACLVGFTGTFGAWHGIDVLAEALPLICKRYPQSRFLLIGDGNKKHLVDEQVERHALHGQVACVGRVPQTEGRRLLGACDLFLATNSAHMVDSPFFGSPTKIFEYMAQGGGIVASDLEQIGDVLSPAIPATHLGSELAPIENERSILFEPGNVDAFVNAIAFLIEHPEVRQQLGANARRAAEEHYTWKRHVDRLLYFAAEGKLRESDLCEPTIAAQFRDPAEPRRREESHPFTKIETGDRYKDEVQAQWNDNPCGSQHGGEARRYSLTWFQAVEEHRYGEYAPWMPEVMEFSQHPRKKVLEVGAGMGTDLAQFARHGSYVTDVDLAAGHLAAAKENFRVRGLECEFVHHDAEGLPFEDNTFDVVYSNGVIHHTPNTRLVIDEMYRVLKPGGRVIVMVYAEDSQFYWREKVIKLGVQQGALHQASIGHLLSEGVERTTTGTRPLVKVYTRARLRNLFRQFDQIEIVKRQLTEGEVPPRLKSFSALTLSKVMGWNLVLKANKPLAEGISATESKRQIAAPWSRAAAL